MQGVIGISGSCGGIYSGRVLGLFAEFAWCQFSFCNRGRWEVSQNLAQTGQANINLHIICVHPYVSSGFMQSRFWWKPQRFATTLCSVPSSLVQLLQWWKRAAYVSYCPQQLYYRLLGLVSALFFPWCETMDSKVCPCFLHSNTGNKLQQYQSYETLTSRFTVCWPALWSQYQVSTDRPACLNPQTEMRQCGAVSCAV